MSGTSQRPIAPDAVRQNIEAIANMESAALRKRSLADKAADGIATFVGTIAFVLLHVVWFGVWATVNLGLISGFKPFDPYPFQLLCMIVSLEGVLLATFVLIKQNRMGYLTDRRAHLDLQINLLSEREVTRLLRLMHLVAERLEVAPKDGTTPELAEETQVEKVAEALDRRLSAEQ